MRMRAPDNCTSLYVEGDVYDVIDGHADVAPGRASVAQSHGFEPVPGSVEDMLSRPAPRRARRLPALTAAERVDL